MSTVKSSTSRSTSGQDGWAAPRQEAAARTPGSSSSSSPSCLLVVGDRRRRLGPVLPAGVRRVEQRLHLLGDGARPGADLQGHRRRQLRPGRHGDVRHVHLLRAIAVDSASRSGWRSSSAMAHLGGRRRGHRTGLDPTVRPTQPPGDHDRHARPAAGAQLDGRRSSGALDPRAFPTPFPKRNESFSFLGAPASSTTNLFTWITILVAVLLVSLLLNKTKIGLGVPLGVAQPGVQPARRHPHRPHAPVRLGARRRRSARWPAG